MSQGKRGRVHSRKFKLEAVNRMLAGESATALSRELHIRRKLLYRWRNAYLVGGAEGLRQRGRPRKGEMRGIRPGTNTEPVELLLAHRRIEELERKVGRQQLENDFFVEALRRMRAIQEEQDAKDAECSTSSSETKRREAN